MKIQRAELSEHDGVFSCTVSVPMEFLGEFLALLPVAKTWLDVPVLPAKIDSPASNRSQDERAPIPAIPTPSKPSEAILSGPAEDHSAALADPKTQVISPPGFDISKLGMGRSLAREVLVFLFLVRDPLFQEWVLDIAKVSPNAVPDAVEFAANWVAKRLDVPSLFELPPEKYGRLAEIQMVYDTWLKARKLS